MDEIFEAVKALALTFAAPFTSIEHGALPTENSLAMYPGPGYSPKVFLDRARISDVFFVLNGKHANAKTLVAAMGAIHRGLSIYDGYPLRGNYWQVLNVETSTPPNLLERESSGARASLYGSMLKVTIYLDGGIPK